MNIKIPLWACFFLCSTFIYSQATITGELQKWHTVTLTYNGPNTSENASVNPFLQYRLNVTFTSPSGKTFVIPGYFAADGNAAQTSANSGNKWRVRFTPNETGNWSYNTSFRSGTDIAVNENSNAGNATSFDGATGNFNISASNKGAPDNRARGRLNYVGERYLKFEETGEYFLKAGSDSPENLLAYNDFDNTVAKKTWSPHAQDWKNGDPTWKGNNGKELIGAINYLSDKGMNAFSFLTMNINGDGKDVWPWASTKHSDLDGNSGSDVQNRLRYDVSKLAQWEILFSHADAKGMYLHFKTQETENDQLLDGGDLGIQRKLYYRELIARFGHHLALNWNLGEENNLYNTPNNSNSQRRGLGDTQNARVKAYTSYIKRLDPYNHHMVIHSFSTIAEQESLYRPLLGNDSELTGASTQLQINTIHTYIKKWILESKNSGKQWVVTNDEQGDARSGVTADASFNGSKGERTDNRKDTRHKVLWGTLMAGGAGVEYYFGYATGETDLTAQNFRSRDLKWDDAKTALDFFNAHVSFWEMDTNDGLTSSTTDYCLAKENDTYLIYLPNGGSTNLNLSNVNGSFSVKWFNPKNGGNLVNGSVSEINGGGNRNIGTPPNNTSSDWVALVKKGEQSNSFEHDDCSIELSAIADFSNTDVSGFSPAYVDNIRNALAINAGQFKDKFAAAETSFSGETGTYEIRLNTLTELDGESTYNLRINGTLVGTYTNPTTSVDYGSAGVTFSDVAVSKGDTIRVEFNSNTNGKIPEGNSTAFSRGRWTSLSFKCQNDTAEPPTGDCDADAEEENGLVVIEAESLNTVSGWVNKTSESGFTGSGYIDWQGADSFNTPGNGMITAKIKINTPGKYLFRWRSKVGEGTNPTESNDSWLRFPDADDFYGQKGGSKVYPRGIGKTPNPLGASSDGWLKVFLSGTTDWTWTSRTSDNDARDIYVEFDAAGTYIMEISGRSKHHLIDRIVLSKGVANATSLALNETLCTGGETTPIAVTGVVVSPQNATIVEGSSLNISVQVLPTTASDKSVVWSSSDVTIATVNQNGVVSALNVGDVVISAKSQDGGLVGTSAITVTERIVVTNPVKGIYVTPQHLTIEVGQTGIVSYRIRPSTATNKNATWRSSDTSIATVDQNGVVTALKQGDVEIEAISEDGGFRSDSSVKVIAVKGGAVPVTSIAISRSSASVVEGNSIILDYEILPNNASNKSVAWSSSDTRIATVNRNGVVTASRIGNVVISVTSEDGGFVATTAIQVIQKPSVHRPVSGIYVTPQFLNLRVGQKANVRYALRPSNASNKDVIWYSENTSVATVDQNGLVTAVGVGKVEIVANTVDGNFRSDSSVTVTGSTGTNEQAIIAYPNPTRDQIRIGGVQGKSGLVSIYGFNGVLVEEKNVKGGEEAIISLAGQPAGIYVVKVLDEVKSKTKTIIKK